MLKPKAGESDPLWIAPASIDGIRGRIGLTLCPGKKQAASLTGPWDHDLDTDLSVIPSFGAAAPEAPSTAARMAAPTTQPPRDLLPRAVTSDKWRVTSDEKKAKSERGKAAAVYARDRRGRPHSPASLIDSFR